MKLATCTVKATPDELIKAFNELPIEHYAILGKDSVGDLNISECSPESWETLKDIKCLCKIDFYPKGYFIPKISSLQGLINYFKAIV